MREDALEAAAVARRERVGGEGSGGAEVEHVELVLAASRWFDPGALVSSLNMRGFLGEIVEAGLHSVELHLWRSYQDIEEEKRVCAPAWRRRDGKELYSLRREKGFSEPVTYTVSWQKLVGDVRGIECKGGVLLGKSSVARRCLRGEDRVEERGEET